ncbi:MAG: transglycosylase domain-containing protein [Bacteroidota bacterium]
MPDRPSYSDEDLARFFEESQAHHGTVGATRSQPVDEAAQPTGAVSQAAAAAQPVDGDGARGPSPREIRPARPGDPRPVTPRDAEKRTAMLLRRVGMLVAGLAVLGLIYFVYLWSGVPPLAEIENPENLESTLVYSADGEELARYYLGENRTWVPVDSLPQHLIDALVATEDRRFYNHWGLDLYGMVAVVANAPFRGLRGASTITQQLARNLFRIRKGGQPGISQKFREMLTAVQIERNYTKREIIEMYFNTVAFSNNAFGIQAASRTYFNKSASQLDLGESAVLIGMQKATTYYNPVRNPGNAQRRRNVVMNQMVRYGYLDRGTYDALAPDSVRTDFQPYSHTDNMAPHFAEVLRLWLKDWAEENGYDIYQDGLQVHTTIDSRMQALATAAVEAQMTKLQAVVDVDWSASDRYFSYDEDAYVRYVASNDVEPFAHYFDRFADTYVRNFIHESERARLLRAQGFSRDDAIDSLRSDAAFMDSLRTEKTRIEGGLVAVDPATGAVRAWVGGKNFVEDKYDHVMQAQRQPGSTFKPFAYAAAVDNGFSPYYALPNEAFCWDIPGSRQWCPRGGGSGGYVSLARGLATSNNIIAARLTREIGPARVALYAQRMGVQSPIDAVPSVALGASDVNLLEMTAAYATLASGGIYHAPTFVSRITDRFGNTVAAFYPEDTGQEALSASSAYTVVDMMRGAIEYGTATRISSKFGLGAYDFAAKTGTTQESADGWFIMMHPEVVVGSWVGWNDRRVSFRSDWWGQGGHSALYLVGDFARRLSRASDPAVRLAKTRFREPAGYVEPLPLDMQYDDQWYDRTQCRELDDPDACEGPRPGEDGRAERPEAGRIEW